MVQGQNFTIIFRVKDIFGTCGLETLFVGISVSIYIADDI